MSRRSPSRPTPAATRWVALGIVLLVFASFLPALSSGWVGWDDDALFMRHHKFRALDAENLGWMFSTFQTGHYQPLTWLSFALDYQLWEMNPAGYHFVNVMLHAVNAVLFFLLIAAFIRRRPEVIPSGTWGFPLACGVGALFFAIHPLRAESVAWVIERRDTLAGLFYLLTLHTYLRMLDRQGSARRRMYILSVVCFALSLGAKAWGITLPVALLILDIYPLRRFRTAIRQCLLEKVPYLLLALAFAGFAFHAQKHAAMEMVVDHTLFDRLMQSAYALSFYIGKTILPLGLSPLYLLKPSFDPLAPKYILGAVVSLGITVVLLLLRKRWPWALAAWACYAVVVSPVLGIAQSGPQITADRYTYLSCLPFGVLAAAGAAALINRRNVRLLIVPLLLALGVLTFRQAGIWHDSGTLWEHAIKLDPSNYIAFNNRGYFVHERQGNLGQAIRDYSAAIDLNPEYVLARYNRAGLRLRQGNHESALQDLNEVIRRDPDHTAAYVNRAAARHAQGDIEGAIADLDAAVAVDPTFSTAYQNRAMIRAQQGDLAGALADVTTAIEFEPYNGALYMQRARLRSQLGDAAGAQTDYNEAIRLQRGR